MWWSKRSGSAGFSGCGKTRNESFRRAEFARGISFFLGWANKSRSLTSFGMTKRDFVSSLSWPVAFCYTFASASSLPTPTG